MESGLTALKGKDIKTAFDVLGYPKSQQEFDGDRVYYWETADQPTGYYCEIKMITDAQKVIQHSEYTGNLGGCGRWIDALNEYTKRRS